MLPTLSLGLGFRNVLLRQSCLGLGLGQAQSLVTLPPTATATQKWLGAFGAKCLDAPQLRTEWRGKGCRLYSSSSSSSGDTEDVESEEVKKKTNSKKVGKSQETTGAAKVTAKVAVLEEEEGEDSVEGRKEEEEVEEEDQEEEKSMSEKLAGAADIAQAVLTPQRVTELLGRHIVGQDDAKRSVAIALRNRWRRSRVKDEALRKEIAPKNILMIGPTGCGKTEIARRLASLADAPFVKVEATKFTEVGFHGRDVDEMVRELVEAAVVLTKKRWKKIKKREVQTNVEKKILQSLLGGEEDDETRKTMTQFYRDGEMEDKEVTIEVPMSQRDPIFANLFKTNVSPALENNSFNDMILKIERTMTGKEKKPTERKTMKIGKARPLLEDLEMDKLLTTHDLTKEAVKIAEEEGIIFIDEIDKIVTPSEARTGTEASSEGVQQDLLPIVEGSLVNTKFGQVSTNHMLFVASGSFHNVKPSDMLAELQGRLPIRVELTGLTKEDLYKILTEPDNNMMVQQKALLATEGVDLNITNDAILEIAEVAYEVNRHVDNIGARRLHTVLERVLDEVSFDASEQGRVAKEEGRECHIVIDKSDVQEKVGHLVQQTDLSRFIL